MASDITDAESEPRPIAVATQASSFSAKADAVANLTMRAYERASLLELTPEEREKLQEDFPHEAFRTGAAGKENLIYIEHAHLRDRLNHVLGLGAWSLIPRQRWSEDASYTKNGELVKATLVYVEAMLIIRGCFVAEAIGDMTYYPENRSTNFGDAVEGAKSAALRRCAKELGVGLQPWKKGFQDQWFREARERVNGAAQREREQAEARDREQRESEGQEYDKLLLDWNLDLGRCQVSDLTEAAARYQKIFEERNIRFSDKIPAQVRRKAYEDMVHSGTMLGLTWNKEAKHWSAPPRPLQSRDLLADLDEAILDGPDAVNLLVPEILMQPEQRQADLFALAHGHMSEIGYAYDATQKLYLPEH